MRSLVPSAAVSVFAALSTLAAVSAPALGQMADGVFDHVVDLRPTDAAQSYWSSFRAPESIETEPTLRAGSAARVWSALDRNGLLVYADTLGGRAYELVWFERDRAFGLLADGLWIDDLKTSVGADGRPRFAGAFDRSGAPAITGLVDVDSGDLLMVQIDAPGAEVTRAVVMQGTIVIAAKCNCFGTAKNKKDCSDADCDVSEDCQAQQGGSGSAYCRWSAAHHKLPVDPGGDR